MSTDKSHRTCEDPPPYSLKPPPPQAGELPPGYQPYPGPAPPPQWQNYGATALTETAVIIQTVGACPACRIGFLEDDYTCLGIFCAIFFFPLGILACLLLRNRRCSNCGALFG
ncbi:hypothetical protein ONE63_001704 [Megalurothrips usitatus]|uniref:Membrane protein BRI3 n=1 Tax=Megalurothrips usitatus TaxID=439358 RepID=A0AAV7X948_9NEOP|nr:hypothetical protein ONE63_001704 [Megalurothrips usitatus]